MTDDKHGSPFDRGMADKYYERKYQPHFYPQGTYNGDPIVEKEMTPDEVMAYNKGWGLGDRKEQS